MTKFVFAMFVSAVLFATATAQAQTSPAKVQAWSDASVRIVQATGYGAYAYDTAYREVVVGVRSSTERKTVTLEIFTPDNTLAEWKMRAVETALRRYFRHELPRRYRLEVIFIPRATATRQ